MLIPSSYEPCGLNHAQGFQYYVIPVASAVRSLALPPVKDGVNSFLFEWIEGDRDNHNRFYAALCRAIDVFFSSKPTWKEMKKSAKKAAPDYYWKNLVGKYHDLFN